MPPYLLNFGDKKRKKENIPVGIESRKEKNNLNKGDQYETT